MKDGRYLKSLDPFYKTIPFIMRDKNDACNLFADHVEVTELDRYLRNKRLEGYKGMGMLHMFIAAYVRTVSQRPALNRFIRGQRVCARNCIEVVLTVKKAMSAESGETTIKVKFEPTDTIFDVYQKMNESIEKVKNNEETNTDNVAGKLMSLPRFIIRGALKFLTWLDYHGWLPQVLLDASPFHGSMIISDLGSLGIPSIYHHLYNFGNLPVFITFGAKRRSLELEKDGTVCERKYIDYTVVADERICDGFDYAQGFKMLKAILRQPEQLETPPETVHEDLAR